jgi:hypothetical protein
VNLPEDAIGEPFEVRLDRLLFPRPVPAGMDWSVIGIWAAQQRKTADPVNPPIEVYREPDHPFWRLRDGRHRVVAGFIAGRDWITAVEVPAGRPRT